MYSLRLRPFYPSPTVPTFYTLSAASSPLGNAITSLDRMVGFDSFSTDAFVAMSGTYPS